MNKNLKNLKSSFRRKQKSAVGQATQSSNAIAKAGTLGDPLNTQMQKNMELNFVQLISDLPMTLFIKCCLKPYDLSNLIINKQVEFCDSKKLDNAWLNLLSQYNDVRKDERQKRLYEIRLRMQVLRLRAEIITLLLNSVGMIYLETIIDAIKSFDDEFSQFEFSEESIVEDLQCIKNIEINNEIEYQDLKKEFEEMEKDTVDKDGNKVKTSEDVFYDYVFSYNEIFKTSFTLSSLSAMDYAKMCNRRDLYIESQNAKANG
jgi:hypothetical protein